MKKKKDTTQALMMILQAAKELGWFVAVDDNKDDEVHGMVIGTEEYMDTILKCEVGKASDLYQTEDEIETQRVDRVFKEQQKQNITDIMKSDEETGLYD